MLTYSKPPVPHVLGSFNTLASWSLIDINHAQLEIANRENGFGYKALVKKKMLAYRWKTHHSCLRFFTNKVTIDLQAGAVPFDKMG